MNKYITIDEYISAFPVNIQIKLNQIRDTIRKAVPSAAKEKISYGIPTFYFKGNLVHFAAFKNHFSFFPASSGVEKFKKELSPYKTSKGTIQFSLDEDLPLGLIVKIVKFRLQENIDKNKQ